MLALAFNVQAQTTTSKPVKTSTPKSARATTTTPIIDSASNAGATNDGASGQSGRPVAIPSSSTSQGASTRGSSTQRKSSSTRKVKQRTRSNS